MCSSNGTCTCNTKTESIKCVNMVNEVYDYDFTFVDTIEMELTILKRHHCDCSSVAPVNYDRILKDYNGNIEAMHEDVSAEIDQDASDFKQWVAEHISLIEFVQSRMDVISAPFPKKGGDL